MSPDLDERQRAMLAEMGIRLFAPVAQRLPAAAPAGSATAAATAAPVQLRPAGMAEGHDAAGARPARGAGAAEPAREPAAAARPAGDGVRTAPAAGDWAPQEPAEATSPRAPAQQRPAVAAPLHSGARPEGIAAMDWTQLQSAVAGCGACGLCQSHRNTVFGVGPQQAEWMVVGEAPGENEDLQGEPFVGQAGKLLDNMLRALGLNRRDSVYIANVLKCRPPGNRNPEPAEVAQCEPYLRRQVELVQPKIILAMGRFAIQSLLQTTEPVGRLRGRVHQYNGVPLVVTYHPAYLLRNLPEKAKAWADLCLARALMQGTLPVPGAAQPQPSPPG